MLHITSNTLSLSSVNSPNIREIIKLFFVYQTETRDEVLHGYSRGLALASDLHALLMDTPYSYGIWYNDRHLTISIFKRDEYHGESIQSYKHILHPHEVLRIMESEQEGERTN
jgi:hypothetical protein